MGIEFIADEGGGREEDQQILLITARSSNTDLIPDESIKIEFSDGVSDADRGSINILPHRDASGTSVITVTADDGSEFVEKSFEISVEPVNDSPIASDLEMKCKEDIPLNSRVGAFDIDSEVLTYEITEGTSRGKVELIDSKTGGFLYTPEINFVGSDSFSYIASDGELNSKDSKVTIFVEPINDAPSISEIQDFVIMEDERIPDIEFVVEEGGGRDEDSQNLTVKVSSSNHELFAKTDMEIELIDDNIGKLSIKSLLNHSGAGNVTIEVSDGKLVTESSFEIKVTSVNDKPTISTIEDRMTDEDHPLKAIQFTVDEGGGEGEDSQVLTLSMSSTNPQLVQESNIIIRFGDDTTDATGGEIDIIPSENEHGTSTLTIMVDDGADSVEESFEITVHPANDPPVSIQGLKLEMYEDAKLEGHLEAVDVDNDPLEFEIVDPPSNGQITFTDKLTGAYEFIPNFDFNGNDSFTFQVSDGQDISNTSMVSLDIQPVNDPPLLSPFKNLSSDEDLPILGVPFEVGKGRW